MKQAYKMSVVEIDAHELIPGVELVNFGKVKSIGPTQIYGKGIKPIHAVKVGFDKDGKCLSEESAPVTVLFHEFEKVIIKVPEFAEGQKLAVTSNKEETTDIGQEGLIDTSFLYSDEMKKAMVDALKSLGIIKPKGDE